MEYLLTFIFVVYFINYLIGLNRNKKISSEWLEKVRGVIFSNFAVIGTSNMQIQGKGEIQFE